jgi:Amt family ammonium transporter
MEDFTTAVSEFTVSIDTIWILIAAVLVMFMQPGFALVEAGFTRSKNTANILMKNLMDFSIGSLIFWLLGYTLMYGEDLGGFVGKISLFFGSDEINGVPDKASLMFQTVFAATAATIVSGAVAERTKFTSYIVFSIAITAVIYPISGHWVWGGGWLSTMATPFHDFAGSTVVHSVGAWVGLAGATVIGPRLGKYTKEGKARAIPGQNLALGALGVFILWFGWFGFNPGSQLAASRFRKCFCHLPHFHHHQPGSCRWCRDGHDRDLDEIQTARSVYYPERGPGRAGGHHSRL